MVSSSLNTKQLLLCEPSQSEAASALLHTRLHAAQPLQEEQETRASSSPRLAFMRQHPDAWMSRQKVHHRVEELPGGNGIYNKHRLSLCRNLVPEGSRFSGGGTNMASLTGKGKREFCRVCVYWYFCGILPVLKRHDKIVISWHMEPYSNIVNSNHCGMKSKVHVNDMNVALPAVMAIHQALKAVLNVHASLVGGGLKGERVSLSELQP